MARRDLTRKGPYLFFHGQWPSNWEASPMTIDGIVYTCVEQYMMAEKCRTFGDQKTLARVMATADPEDQKRYGRQAGPYNEEAWAARRYWAVLRGTLEKYRQNHHLMAFLANEPTGIFVEASPSDTVWGIGMSQTDAGIEDPANWRGTNLLGKAITQARDLLLYGGDEPDWSKL